MRILKSFLVSAALTLNAGVVSASSTTVDFESFDFGDIVSGIDLGGFTLNTGFVQQGPLGNKSILPTNFDYTQRWRADFTLSGVTGFAVDLGDLGSDADDLFLFAYDGMDNLLDSDSAMLAANVLDMLTLSVSSATDIAYVVFYGEGFNSENNIYADNLVVRHTSMPPVPLPASALLLGAALAGMGLLRKRR